MEFDLFNTSAMVSIDTIDVKKGPTDRDLLSMYVLQRLRFLQMVKLANQFCQKEYVSTQYNSAIIMLAILYLLMYCRYVHIC